MAESRWIMVRMDRSTHKRLCEVRDSLLRAQEQGKIALEVDSRDRVSLDQVINLLIDQRADHSNRRKAAAKRRRGPLASDVDSQTSEALPATDECARIIPA